MIKTETFPDVVGQPEAKKKLAFYLNSYNHTHIMPNLMFCAQKGQGKSMLAKELAKQLIAYGEDDKPLLKPDGKTTKKKTWLELNAVTIKTLNGFVRGTLAQHVVDKDCTVFIDEAHMLKKDVEQALLTMLNPNETNRTQFVHDDYTVDLDFRKQTFIFATSESQDIVGPLMNRLKRIDLQSYSLEDLGQIAQKGAPEVSFIEGVLEDIATVVRSNAREAVKMAGEVRTYLCGNTKFGRRQWNDLKDILSIKPLGLSPIEIDLMRFMAERPGGSSLTNLAARSGLSRGAVQQDYESFLQHCGFMEITAGKGRQLTARGYEYLKVNNFATA